LRRHVATAGKAVPISLAITAFMPYLAQLGEVPLARADVQASANPAGLVAHGEARAVCANAAIAVRTVRAFHTLVRAKAAVRTTEEGVLTSLRDGVAEAARAIGAGFAGSAKWLWLMANVAAAVAIVAEVVRGSRVAFAFAGARAV